ncbi:hypothetical protein EJO52_24120 [Salmonella enterica subsp. enterica serovar Enteritidis]|nr:hypothetical protein [Salmonella enterica subsp. enterica serovar Enteritidis]
MQYMLMISVLVVLSVVVVYGAFALLNTMQTTLRVTQLHSDGASTMTTPLIELHEHITHKPAERFVSRPDPIGDEDKGYITATVQRTVQRMLRPVEQRAEWSNDLDIATLMPAWLSVLTQQVTASLEQGNLLPGRFIIRWERDNDKIVLYADADVENIGKVQIPINKVKPLADYWV